MIICEVTGASSSGHPFAALPSMPGKPQDGAVPAKPSQSSFDAKAMPPPAILPKSMATSTAEASQNNQGSTTAAGGSEAPKTPDGSQNIQGSATAAGGSEAPKTPDGQKPEQPSDTPSPASTTEPTPEGLQKAMNEVKAKMESADSRALWARMVRSLQNQNTAPPLLLEKWKAASTNADKNDAFSLYLACGGNIGKMHAIEEIAQVNRKGSTEVWQWYTHDDLMVKLHGKVEDVNDLKERKGKIVGCHRAHPDFPEKDAQKQYLCHKESIYEEATFVERRRALHWTCVVSGEVALECAKNLDSIFSGNAPAELQIAQATGGRGGYTNLRSMVWHGARGLFKPFQMIAI